MKKQPDMRHAKSNPPVKPLAWLFHRTRMARGWIAASVVLGFTGGLLLIAQARLLAHVVNGAFMQHRTWSELRPLFALLGGIVLMRAALAWGREIAGFHAGAKIRQAVRRRILAHLAALGPAYTSRQSTGALASMAVEQVEALHDFFAHYLPQLALAALIPAAMLAFVFPLSWAAGATLLVTAPLIPVFMILVGMGAESVSQKNFAALSRLSAHFLDILQGMVTLKLFDRSRHERRSVAQASAAYRKTTMRVLRIAFLSSAVLEFFSSISIAIVAVYLGMHYLGYLHFGDYGHGLTFLGGFFILLLAPDFYFPLRELGTHYHARAQAMGAADEILKILARPVPAQPRATAHIDFGGPIEIAANDLHLAYDNGRRPALKGVSFSLNSGEKIALVGPSGAGKTSILNLLLGFEKPDRGQIRINHVDLARIDADDWRRRLAWVGQQPVLFHGTLRENIRMGRPAADDGAIRRAADAARVTEFAAHLPEGLDTPVAEGGADLSRGQAQRVALARAYLKQAPILLIDEPTAGLDAHNERMVIQALSTLAKGKTLLLLTHRLLNITRFDRILVLQEGRIRQQGSYTQLAGESGLFRRLLEPDPAMGDPLG